MYLHYNILRISLFTLFFHFLSIHTFNKMFASFVSSATLCSRRKMNRSVDTRRSFSLDFPEPWLAANKLTRLKRNLRVTTPFAPYICKPRRFSFRNRIARFRAGNRIPRLHTYAYFDMDETVPPFPRLARLA